MSKLSADVIERVSWTTVQAAASVGVFYFTENAPASVFTATLFALAKCVVAMNIGDTETAATLPLDKVDEPEDAGHAA